MRLLAQLSVLLLILSPPCTIFSELQRLWNFKKMTQDAINAKWSEGMLYLEHAMAAALHQHQNGRFFAFEHPAKASSWGTAPVRRVMETPGIFVVVLDQCMLGLRSKVHRVPMRKRTKVMTNSSVIARRLLGLMCDGSHRHQTIQGQEGGVSRSAWAQVYPAPMCELLANAACELKDSK